MYQQIRSVIEEDFKAVDKFIVDQLYSNVPLVENIGHYIVEAGGKRLRPPPRSSFRKSLQNRQSAACIPSFGDRVHSYRHLTA